MPENEVGGFVEDDKGNKLTNDDFRKLMMTPRVSSSATPSLSTPGSFSSSSTRDGNNEATPSGEQGDKAERRKNKKSYYAKLKKQEEDLMAELAKKYRDRAKERRDDGNPDFPSEDPLSQAGGYRAVAPDIKSGLDAAERRKQMIQESKFLGGDMEHTHLVKGLDFALLQKVRSEIQTKEKEAEEELEQAFNTVTETPTVVVEKEEIDFQTRLGKNIYRALFKPLYPERNELFAPGRMAYVIDLDDEFADSDIPTTLIRSKADVPQIEEQAIVTTNQFVINKLTQILSGLRQGGKAGKKTKKKDKSKLPFDNPKGNQQYDSIYGEIGDYVPSTDRSGRKDRDDGGSRDKRGNYFEKPNEDDDRRHRDRSHRDRYDRERGEKSRTTAQADQTLGELLKNEESRKISKSQKLLKKLVSEPEGYAECYPGFDEMHDAMNDSDDEADYTQMDMGNKKGPVGRWDFDTPEEYSEYMGKREAMPKAAFQYGVKMGDGRKTRKTNPKSEKQVLERDWQKIQQILQKRKSDGSRDEGSSKRSRY